MATSWINNNKDGDTQSVLYQMECSDHCAKE